MVKPNIFISFRVTTEERLMLQNYCEQTGRGQSDVLREFVRNERKENVTESAHDSPSFQLKRLKYEVRGYATASQEFSAFSL